MLSFVLALGYVTGVVAVFKWCPKPTGGWPVNLDGIEAFFLFPAGFAVGAVGAVILNELWGIDCGWKYGTLTSLAFTVLLYK